MSSDTTESALTRGWRLIRLDAARWLRPQEIGAIEDVTPTRLLKMLARHPSLRAMAWLRFGWTIREMGVRTVPFLIEQRLLTRFGLEISIGGKIGGGLYIAHPVGCVLVVDRIGENVTIVSQVTFGTRNDGRWPVIGDEAFFGVGCRVLGGVDIGRGAQVGANAVVLSDVAAGDTVVGIPARSTKASL